MPRYVLYTSQEDHSADCERFPLAAIPRLVMLDTNVVECLVRYSHCIFEQQPAPIELDETRRRDIEALMHVFLVSSRAYWSWDFCVSPITLEELERTNNRELRSELLEYGITFPSAGDNGGISPELAAAGDDLARRVVDSSLFAALPDREDRMILAHAVAYGCDALCTRDRRTIVQKRDRLPKLPLRIMTPEEWWSHIKPWAGLWC